MKKVSIIIPVYNGEKYIKRCINSVVNQTYKNIEIIIIDDGSTDGTGKIIKEINDKRIIIFNIENKGVSHARNYGIDVSTGDYIMFCDADDWIEKDLIENMIQIVKKNEYDVIRFNYYVNKSKKNNYSKGKNIESNKENDTNITKMIEGIIKAKISSYVWLLFIKKEFIVNNKLKFNENIYVMEDKIFFLQCLYKKPKIHIENKAYYHYFSNSESVMHKKDYKRKIKNIIKANSIINNLLNENKENELINYNIALTAYSIERFIFDIYREKGKKEAILAFEDIKDNMETRKIFENCRKENLKIFKGYNVKNIYYLYNCKYNKLFRLYYIQKFKHFIKDKLVKLKNYIKR